MDKNYVKSVVTGLVVAKICLGFAAVAALITVIVVGWTQIPFLVSWLPVVFIAVFLIVTTLLLGKDMMAQRHESRNGR